MLDTTKLTPDILIPAIILLSAGLLLIYVLWQAQKRADFDIANFLRDEQGKESALRAFAFVALGVTSWIMATLTFKDKLNPDYFLYYVLTWANTLVLVKLAEKWTGNLPFSSKSDGSQPMTTTTTTTKSE